MEVKITRKEWLIYLVSSALTVGIVYAISTDNLDLRMLRGLSRACQGTARVVGKWGLETERAYMTIINNGRMV